jgi:hypothetical protein
MSFNQSKGFHQGVSKAAKEKLSHDEQRIELHPATITSPVYFDGVSGLNGVSPWGLILWMSHSHL